MCLYQVIQVKDRSQHSEAEHTWNVASSLPSVYRIGMSAFWLPLSRVRHLPGHLPGVDEVADGELVGQRGLQPLGVQHQIVVEEAGVGVQQFHLLGPRPHHRRVAVAHWGDGWKTIYFK